MNSNSDNSTVRPPVSMLLATSDTPSARLTAKRITQSCKDRNSARLRFSPFSAYC